MLLFCDLETTGLVPEDDQILEVGFMITTDNLEPVSHMSLVTYFANLEFVLGEDGESNTWEPPFGIPGVVVKMHNDNGLWEECHKSNFTEPMVENMMLTWIKQQGAEGLPLVGSTIGFDREFLRIRMPRLHNLFDYHNLDASSIKYAGNLWSPIPKEDWPPNEKKHRVLPDMMDTLRELDLFRRPYFVH